MRRLLLVADLHLEKGMDYSDDRLAEQEAVWVQALRIGIENEVDAILFAGDATEYRAPSTRARAAFQRPLMGLGETVLAIPGNHDVKHPRYPTALDLMGPAFGGNLLTVSRVPELVPLDGVVVATLPWTSHGRVVARRNGGDRSAAFLSAADDLLHVAEGLAERARREHPGVPVVLLGHWALDKATTPSGKSALDFNEPVLPTERLSELFTTVVFGHVHRPESWGNVVSVGSPMPLDFGEEGCEHGVWILDLDAIFPDMALAFVPIASRRFVTLEGEPVDGGEHGVGLRLPRDVDLRDAVVRVRYTATEEQAARINDARLRQALLDAGAHRVWQITPQIERPARARVKDMGAMGPAEAVDAWIEARGGEPIPGVRDRALEVLDQ